MHVSRSAGGLHHSNVRLCRHSFSNSHLPPQSARIHPCLLSKCPMLKEVFCNAKPSPVEWSLPRRVFPDRCTMPSWNLTLGKFSKGKTTEFPSSLGLSQIQFTSKEYVRTRSYSRFFTHQVLNWMKGVVAVVTIYYTEYNACRYFLGKLHRESRLRHGPLE